MNRHNTTVGLVNPAIAFIRASPDDKVCDNGETSIWEVKCTYSVRNMDVVESVAHFSMDWQDDG